jgi:hypothetical protein
VRVRPAREDGSEGQCPVVVEEDGAGGDGGKLMLMHNAKPEAFRFDRCFPQGSSQVYFVCVCVCVCVCV